LCDVRGRIDLGKRHIDLRAVGYHDHRYATALINAAARPIMRGRAIFNDMTMAFELGGPDAGCVIRANATGAAEVCTSHALVVQQQRWTWLGHRYPLRLRSAGGLELSNPRLIDMGFHQLRLVYEASIDNKTGGRAICEVSYPGRLRWPVAAFWR
jgi:hypothetical protein